MSFASLGPLFVCFGCTILTPVSCGSFDKLAAELMGHAASEDAAGAFGSIVSRYSSFRLARHCFSLENVIDLCVICSKSIIDSIFWSFNESLDTIESLSMDIKVYFVYTPS